MRIWPFGSLPSCRVRAVCGAMTMRHSREAYTTRAAEALGFHDRNIANHSSCVNALQKCSCPSALWLREGRCGGMASRMANALPCAYRPRNSALGLLPTFGLYTKRNKTTQASRTFLKIVFACQRWLPAPSTEKSSARSAEQRGAALISALRKNCMANCGSSAYGSGTSILLQSLRRRGRVSGRAAFSSTL